MESALASAHGRIILSLACLVLPLLTYSALLININTADSAALQELPGIGPAKADAIIAYRNAHGAFTSTAGITNVAGIGDATYAEIKPFITVEAAASSDETEEEASEETESETETQTESEAAGGSALDDTGDNVHISLIVPEQELALVIDAPATTSVHHGIDFSVSASGISDKLIDSLSYQWNFGDGETATGEAVTHSYDFPGTYVVVVDGKYARHEGTSRHLVSVLPVELSVSRSPAGNIVIENTSSHEIDLSRYTARGGTSWAIPDHTVVVAGGTLTIPGKKLNATGNTPVTLADAEGAIVGSTIQQVRPRVVSLARRTASAQLQATLPTVATETETAPLENAAEPMVFRPERQVAAVAAAPLLSQDSMPYLALIGVLLLGTLAMYAKRIV